VLELHVAICQQAGSCRATNACRCLGTAVLLDMGGRMARPATDKHTVHWFAVMPYWGSYGSARGGPEKRCECEWLCCFQGHITLWLRYKVYCSPLHPTILPTACAPARPLVYSLLAVLCIFEPHLPLPSSSDCAVHLLSAHLCIDRRSRPAPTHPAPTRLLHSPMTR